MKKALDLAIAAIIVTITACGCGKKETKKEVQEEYEMEVNMITPDSKTRSASQDNTNNTDISNKVEDNTEHIDEMNTQEQKPDGMEEAIAKSIQETLDKIGSGLTYEIVDERYTDIYNYTVISKVNNSTLMLTSIINENTATIETYESGSENGSDYGGLIGINKLEGVNIADIEEALLNSSIFNVCTVIDKNEDGYVISDGTLEYIIRVNGNEVTVEIYK